MQGIQEMKRRTQRKTPAIGNFDPDPLHPC